MMTVVFNSIAGEVVALSPLLYQEGSRLLIPVVQTRLGWLQEFIRAYRGIPAFSTHVRHTAVRGIGRQYTGVR
ncbi:hypothetical protein GCK32_021137 [Trichostrongylus colubriformis]|uniref:Uncharacterized protein n=1 Tax=Trichostrongylus colubriformis TaxID=6319 RepID=A0AAN8F9V4_TRICO